MIPKYSRGERVRFNEQVRACDRFGQYTSFYVPTNTVGIAEYYEKKATEKIDDDLVKIKITGCDEKSFIEKEIWVKAADFEKVKDTY